jgi:hypothetical protein
MSRNVILLVDDKEMEGGVTGQDFSLARPRRPAPITQMSYLMRSARAIPFSPRQVTGHLFGTFHSVNGRRDKM